jgi:hypothetical protein
MVLAKRSGQIFTVNADIELIPSPCKGALENLIGTVRAELHIVSPYVTDAGTALITNRLKTSARRSSIAVQLLTDLNPLSVCQGSCDPQAILHMTRSFPRARITHLPRMHAKIMIADRADAIIGSANLTEGGIQDNYEYCINISSPKIASRIAEDVEEYSSLGALITIDLLESYSNAAISLRDTFHRKEQAVSSSLRKEFKERVRSADDLLLRARVRANEGVTGIFSRTILLLLRARPMTTVDIHPQIKKIHPDLCDDSVDRVIDGERFGKKWKHLVRTAQQVLKRNGLIEFDGRFWRLAQ